MSSAKMAAILSRGRWVNYVTNRSLTKLAQQSIGGFENTKNLGYFTKQNRPHEYLQIYWFNI